MNGDVGNSKTLATFARFALPNSLTLARLIVGLIYFWLPTSWRFPAILFAGLSDLVDGWFSRRLGATSSFGKLLDPIADKACVLAVVTRLLHDGKLRLWELLLVAQRDIVVVGCAVVVMSIARHKLRQMPARISGKIATAGQFLFLTGQLALESPPRALFILASVLSSIAALDYFRVAVASYRAYKTEGGHDSGEAVNQSAASCDNE